MSIKISSKQFFNTWVKVTSSRRENLSKIWRNSKEFTFAVKGANNSVIDEIANQLNLFSYPKDYYCIDAILYEKNDLTPNIPNNTFWFRSIRVAFEHENNFNGGLYQEVSHLLITNADLKVLVTYPNCSDPFIELNYLHTIIKGTKEAKEISDNETFLIILGYENNFTWEGFVFKYDKWLQIF